MISATLDGGTGRGPKEVPEGYWWLGGAILCQIPYCQLAGKRGRTQKVQAMLSPLLLIVSILGSQPLGRGERLLEVM